MKEFGIIYKYTNKINNKSYIGQTVQTREQRFRNGVGYKNCPKFLNAIKKYGIENFEYEILEQNIAKEDLDEREKYWIKYYDTFSNGYNCTSGGLTSVHSEESKRKTSESLKGHPVSDKVREHIKKLNDQRKGIKPENFEAMLSKAHEKSCVKIKDLRDGFTYKSKTECAKHFGHSIYWVNKRIEEGIFVEITEND